jgi:signal transduction histidine kinase
MKISHRLYLTVLPSVVGMLLLAALVYWGQYQHAAPETVLVGGALAVAIALAMTWANARYVARRLERVVVGLPTKTGDGPSLRGVASAIAPGRAMGPPDEIDEIESVVDRLSNAVEIAEVKSADRERLFERRAHDYARLLASLADASVKQLEEVRLPLHILLENRFGDLNENQEEMLGAARAAAEVVDADMLSLRQIASLDLGERLLREDRMKPSDIVDAFRPMLLAAADGARVTLELDVTPLLPAITGDRALLQEALVTLLRATVVSSARDSRLRFEVTREGPSIRFLVRGGGAAPISVRWAAAVRVIQAHGGSVDRSADGLRIDLPIATGR